MKKGILFIENSRFSPNPMIRTLIDQIHYLDEDYPICLMTEQQLQHRHFTNEVVLVDFSLSDQVDRWRSQLPDEVVMDIFDAAGYATMNGQLILNQIQKLELSLTVTLENLQAKRRRQWFAAIGK